MIEYPDTEIKPFRWDLARREQLGNLLDGDVPEVPDEFLHELRSAAARVVALGANANLVFVGRSVENLFDYLSGVFHDIDLGPQLTLLHFSNQDWDADALARQFPAELAALRDYFQLEGLDPAAITTAEKPVRFVDVVARGGTFGNLVAILRHWSGEAGIDWPAVRRRIGFVGLTPEKKTSPNTWRWWQRQSWTGDFRSSQISSISVPWFLWDTIANTQDKVTPSHPHYRWADERVSAPIRRPGNLNALRLAAMLFELGTSSAERVAFARCLAAQPQMSDRALRSLVRGLKGMAG